MNYKSYLDFTYNNVAGNVSFLQLYRNSNKSVYNNIYHTGNLANKLDVNQKDIYISMNTIRKTSRITEDLMRLNMLYLDLDIYNIPGLNKETVLQELNDDYFGRLIPKPTYIIDSGRGLYLQWKINESYLALPRWRKVQSFLHNTLKDFGSDPTVAGDPVRVLRVPGSINSKNNKVVSVLFSQEYCYSLYEITRDYIPSSSSVFKTTNKVHRIYNMATMHYERMQDIEKLLKLRENNNTCRLRETSLFMYRFCACNYYEDINIAKEKLLELIRSLPSCSMCNERRILSWTKSGETYYLKGHHKFTNKKIIDMLDITDDEQLYLNTLKHRKIDPEKVKEKNRNSYKKRLDASGKHYKKDIVAERKLKVAKLWNNGKDINDICRLLHISRSTAYRDLEDIKKGLCSFKKALNTSQGIFGLSNNKSALKSKIRAWMARFLKDKSVCPKNSSCSIKGTLVPAPLFSLLRDSKKISTSKGHLYPFIVPSEDRLFGRKIE